MTKEEIIVTVICAVLGSGALNGLLLHILYKSKLKKEMKAKGDDILAKKIGESLQFVRDMELEIKTQEIFEIDEYLEQSVEDINLFNLNGIYPAIFNDSTSYNEFIGKIDECRRNHEKNLSCKIALNLVFIDRYTRQLGIFMSKNGDEKMLPFWGAMFIYDLQEWQRRMDKLLVKEINKYNYKLESHETRKWRRLRKKEVEKQYEKILLYYLITGKCRLRDRWRMEFAASAINKALSENKILDTI